MQKAATVITAAATGAATKTTPSLSPSSSMLLSLREQHHSNHSHHLHHPFHHEATKLITTTVTTNANVTNTTSAAVSTLWSPTPLSLSKPSLPQRRRVIKWSDELTASSHSSSVQSDFGCYRYHTKLHLSFTARCSLAHVKPNDADTHRNVWTRGVKS